MGKERDPLNMYYKPNPSGINGLFLSVKNIIEAKKLCFYQGFSSTVLAHS